MAGGNSGGSTISSAPWSGAQPYLSQGFQAAQNNILNRPTQFFPGSTVVPYSPESEAAIAATANRALAGSPALVAAQDYTTGVLTDPTHSPVYDALKADIVPSIQGTFAGAGRTGGSPVQAEAIARGLTRGIAPYMESAAARAPALAQADYYDINQLGAAGAAREAKANQYLQDAMARWNFAQTEPASRAQSYISALSGIPVGTTSTTRYDQPGVNPLLAATGIGLGIAGMPTAGGGSLGASALGK